MKLATIGTVIANSISIAVAASTGKRLPDGLEAGKTSNITITSGGIERYYLISIPEKYHKQSETPVILNFHGATRTAEFQVNLTQLSNPYFNDFAIVVYPQGIDRVWQNNPGADPSVNDIQFTEDILDKLETELDVDKKRIWATGKSMGGGFCNTLACNPDLSQRIAAFAPVSGAYYVNTTQCDANTVLLPCNPGRSKIPMLEFHGESDGTIAYTGGPRKDECLPSIPHWIQSWAQRDGLSATNSSESFGNDSTIYSFGTGSDYRLVTQIATQHNDHAWPATVPNADNSVEGRHPTDFNASSIIIEFFKLHAL